MDAMAWIVVSVLIIIAAGGVIFLKAVNKLRNDNDVEETEDLPPAAVSYHSRRYGWRLAEIIDRRKGRVILHVLDHPPMVTVRRQSHLIRF